MTECIIEEIKTQVGSLSDPVDTLYFGGGTPSVIGSSHLEDLLHAIEDNCNLSSPEITIECNPEDITPNYAVRLAELGFNRVSLGVQSFNDRILEYINRGHSGLDARNAVMTLKNNGINNINLDFIYGLPNSTQEQLKEDLELLIKQDIQHVSVYGFTLEENTVFGNWHKKGKFELIGEDKEADSFLYIIKKLKQNGFIQYEVSNFCKQGFESKHNSSYWKSIPYLGIGPGAHSFDGKDRWSNLRNNAKYMNAIEGKKPYRIKEITGKYDRLNERIITGLRTQWGIDLNEIKEKFSYDLYKECRGSIEDLVNRGYVKYSDGHLLLTSQGFLIADKIAEMFIII